MAEQAASKPPPIHRKQVFISYSTKDREFALRLFEDLNTELNPEGVTAWMDRHGLKVGTPNWENDIRTAIRESYTVVYVASPDALTSQYVGGEISISEAYKLKIYPIWARGEHWHDCVPLHMVKTQYADGRMEPGEEFPGKRYQGALEELISQLLGKETTSKLPDKEEILAQLRQQNRPSFISRRNPYKGLESFTEEDNDYFFGRDAFIDELLLALKKQIDDKKPNFLAVIGASGSGKSSVIQAGLIPRLRKDEKLPGSSQWVYLNPIQPGEEPLSELANELRRALSTHAHIDRSLSTIKKDLEEEPRSLHLIAKDIDSHMVVYIDQFEELFTQTTDEVERRQFIDLLMKAAGETENGRVTVIVTMRAAFIEKIMTYRDLTLERDMTLGALLKDSLHTHSLFPMTMSEMREAIGRPAQQAGLQMDDKDRLIGDLAFEMYRQPGALPLLQFMLYRLVEQNPGYLTRQAYDRMGGLKGALDHYGEEIYTKLPSDAHRQLTRDLFLRLVTLDDSGQEASRQRVMLDSLALDDKQRSVLMQEVIEAFVEARLLTEGEMREKPTVEISHEILIHEWKRLQDWLEKNREFIQFQRDLKQDVKAWMNSERSASYLYNGLKLDKALDWFKQGYPITEEEQPFLEAGQRSRRNRRLTMIAGGLITAVGLMLAIGIFSNQQGQNQQQAQTILSQRLGVDAGMELANGNIQHALSLAWTANDTAQPPVLAQNALYRAAYAPQLTRTFDQQHPDEIRSLAFSPTDSNLAASAGREDRQITIFELDSGKIVRQIEIMGAAGTTIVRGLAFAPDGKSIFVGSSDGNLTQWGVDDGQPLQSFDGHSSAILSLALSPTQPQLLTGSEDKTAILWDIETGKVLQRFEGFEGSVRSVAFSPDGKLVMTGSEDQQVVIWDAVSGAEKQRFTSHQGRVASAAFNPNFVPEGRFVLSASDDNGLFYWNIDTGKIIRLFQAPSQRVNQIAFSQDGSRVYGALANGRLAVWDTGTGQVLYELRDHQNHYLDDRVGLWTLAISPDGRSALVGESGGNVSLWNIASEPQLAHLSGHHDQVWTVALSSNGKHALSGSLDGTVLYWNLESDTPPRQFKPSNVAGRQVWSVALSPDGNKAAVGLNDGELVGWNIATDAPFTFAGHFDEKALMAGIFALAFSPDGTQLLSGSDDQTAILWDVASQAQVCRFAKHTDVINSVAFTPDGKKVLTGSADGSIILWSLETCDDTGSAFGILHEFPGTSSIRSLSVSPDGNTLLAGSQDGQLVLWNMNTFQPLSRSFARYAQQSQRGWGVAISPDGKTALSAAADNSIAYWDLSTGELITSFKGHTDGIMRLLFSADGKEAISASLDGTVILWRIDDLDDLKSWITANRPVAPLTCAMRQQYDIQPLPCTA